MAGVVPSTCAPTLSFEGTVIGAASGATAWAAVVSMAALAGVLLTPGTTSAVLQRCCLLLAAVALISELEYPSKTYQDKE